MKNGITCHAYTFLYNPVLQPHRLRQVIVTSTLSPTSVQNLFTQISQSASVQSCTHRFCHPPRCRVIHIYIKGSSISTRKGNPRQAHVSGLPKCDLYTCTQMERFTPTKMLCKVSDDKICASYVELNVELYRVRRRRI